MRANAALAAEVLGPRLPPGTPLRITVDDGWELDALNIFADNLERRLAGQPLLNVVDPVRGY